MRKHFSIDYSYDTRQFLEKFNKYEEKLNARKFELEELAKPLSGSASEEGVQAFITKHKETVHADNFSRPYQVGNTVLPQMSSIGLGSYIGKPDDINDFYLYNAVKASVASGGVNVIDTAINYRYMLSEQAIGCALTALERIYNVSRTALWVCSKIGYVPEDARRGRLAHDFIKNLVEKEEIKMDDVIFDEKNRPVHCIHPAFLKEQLEISLSNLKVETLDVLYLHNVFETQGTALEEKVFNERLSKAFEQMEQFREEGKIKYFGLASWNSFRVAPDYGGGYSNLQKLVKLAKEVGGEEHGFRFVQAPVNLYHPEVFAEKYQVYQGEEKSANFPLSAVAGELGVNIITSSPLLQGQMVNLPLENTLFNVKHVASKHLQLIRSIPAESFKSTLVGMKQMHHVKQNMEVTAVRRLSKEEFLEVMKPKKREEFVESPN